MNLYNNVENGYEKKIDPVIIYFSTKREVDSSKAGLQLLTLFVILRGRKVLKIILNLKWISSFIFELLTILKIFFYLIN